MKTEWLDIARRIIRGEVVYTQQAIEFIDENGGPPMDMPPLHPAEHAWVERMTGRKMTNEEAQLAILDATAVASVNYWADGKVN